MAWGSLVSPMRKEIKMQYEEIPDLAKYLPDEVETADLIGKTVPPTKCVIKKGVNYGRH